MRFSRNTDENQGIYPIMIAVNDKKLRVQTNLLRSNYL